MPEKAEKRTNELIESLEAEVEAEEVASEDEQEITIGCTGGCVIITGDEEDEESE